MNSMDGSHSPKALFLGLSWLLLASFSAFSQVPSLEEIEQSDDLDLQLESELKADLQAIDFQAVDNLIKEEDEKEKRRFRKLRFKPRERPWSPVPFKALMKKGSTLIHIDTGKQIRTGRQLFVLAREKVQGSETSYVYDSSGNFKFQTATSNLVSIQTDINLEPQIDPTVIYEEPDTFNSDDEGLKLETLLSLHGENVQVHFIRELFGTESKAAAGNRLDITSFFRTIMPLQFGFSLNYQKGVLEDVTGTYTWDNLFIGPSAKYIFYQKRKVEWNLQASFQQSLSFELRDPNFIYNLSSNVFGLELQRVKESKWGKWFVGATYRRYNPHVKNTDNPNILVDSDRGLIESYALSVGYRWDWELWKD